MDIQNNDTQSIKDKTKQAELEFINTHFLTNNIFEDNENAKLINHIKSTIKERSIQNIDIIIGYFNPMGFNKIAELLPERENPIKISNIRILVGISAQKIHDKHSHLDKKSIPEEEYKKELIENFRECIQGKENKIESDDSLKTLEEFLSKNLQMRMITEKSAHAKMYVFYRNINENGYEGEVITGSSNLTLSGLEDNCEINMVTQNESHIKSALQIFDKLWEDSKTTITIEDINRAKKNTHLDENIKLKDAYYKLLISYFGERIYSDSNIKEVLQSIGAKPLDYQADAIAQALKMLDSQRGLFLSDVVGLGKTITALAIALKLIKTEKITKKVLVTAPKALESVWRYHINNLGNERSGYFDFKRHSQLKDVENPGEYELIIVDESHAFRNHKAQRYYALQQIIGSDKRVLLLSATPQNNSPKDIRNQLFLFCPISKRVGAQSIKKFFDEQQANFKTASKENIETMRKELKKISQNIKENVLKHFMIRRTRQDLKDNYADDLAKQNISFPKPDIDTKKYKLDIQLLKLCEETLYFLDEYKFARYGIFGYLNDKGKKLVEKDEGKWGFRSRSAKHLQELMLIQLFKRFESSFHAFKTSLKNQLISLREMLESAIENEFIKHKTKEYDDFEVDDIGDFDEEQNEQKDSKQSAKQTKFVELKLDEHFENKTEFLCDLKSDMAKLEKINAAWEKIDESKKDPKFDEFEKLISTLDEKVVVFTESVPTAEFLNDRLSENKKLAGKILFVNSQNYDETQNDIRSNFDANVDKDKQRDDFKILISTDILAEGVNMHRANAIINYDVPWNPTKLMQRIGRINRIGTEHGEILVRNFEPSNLGNNILDLKRRVIKKLQSFHYTLGDDSAAFSKDEEIMSQSKLFEVAQREEDEEKDGELKHLIRLKNLLKSEPEYFEKCQNLVPKLHLKITDFAADFTPDSTPDSTADSTKNSTAESAAQKFIYLQFDQDFILDKHQFYTFLSSSDCADGLKKCSFLDMADSMFAHLEANAKTTNNSADFAPFAASVIEELKRLAQSTQRSQSPQSIIAIKRLKGAIHAFGIYESERRARERLLEYLENNEHEALAKDIKSAHRLNALALCKKYEIGMPDLFNYAQDSAKSQETFDLNAIKIQLLFFTN